LNISLALRVFGIVTFFVGFIAGVYFSNSSSVMLVELGYDSQEVKDRTLITMFTYWLFATAIGLFFLGLSKIIDLLYRSIYATEDGIQKNINTSLQILKEMKEKQ
jgi:Mn2+/Fe2+ NRAMP family transporter